MAFGQSSGPPATGRQVQQLTALLQAAGHADFREARGPLGLTQRQAGGKFTRDEADALIAQLEGEADGRAEEPTAEAPAPPSTRSAAGPAADRRQAERARQLRELPTEVLAAELQRRGWVVMEP